MAASLAVRARRHSGRVDGAVLDTDGGARCLCGQHARQRNDKTSALPQSGLDRDLTAKLFKHQIFYNRQTQPGAATANFGTEKWLKQFCQLRCTHAHTIVCKTQFHLIAFR